MPPRPVKQQVQATPYLIVGRALKVVATRTATGRAFRTAHAASDASMDTLASKYITEFLVEENLKGKLSINDTILLSTSFSSCALSFERGSRYVLFLHEEGKLLLPTDCSYSSKLYAESFSRDLLKHIYKAARQIKGK